MSLVDVPGWQARHVCAGSLVRGLNAPEDGPAAWNEETPL